MGFADLLTHGYDDALPADHRAQAERESDRAFYPERDVFGNAVQIPGVILEWRLLGGIRDQVALVEFANRRRSEIKVGAQGNAIRLGEVAERTDRGKLLIRVAGSGGESGVGLASCFARFNERGEFFFN